jgi:ProP effector
LFTGQPLPLAIGSDTEIARRLDLTDQSDRKALSIVLGKATGRKSYLRALAAENAMRHDLDGNPVEPVSDDHRQHAQFMLEQQRLKTEAKKQAAQSTDDAADARVIPTPSAPGPA